MHAHIYNLSRENVSILLNEDARGAGVNNALSLKNINLTLYKMFKNTVDKYLEEKLNDYLNFIIK